MAIYRPPKARWPLAVAAGVAGLLGGLLVGLAVGSTEPDPVEGAREVRSALAAAAGSLEVAGIEYQEAVDAGNVESRPEYEGALDAMASSHDRYETDARPALELLVPSLVDRLDLLYERCDELMKARADSTEVGSCLTELEEELKGVA